MIEGVRFELTVESVSATHRPGLEEVTATAPASFRYGDAPITDITFSTTAGTFRVGQEVSVGIAWHPPSDAPSTPIKEQS